MYFKTLSYQKKIHLFYLLLLSTIASSQELPPIAHYLPENYGAEAQNWSISQASNKFIYVANTIGLLEFNGSHWNVYPTPNKTAMRSVNAVNDRIYTGCYMNFGFWKKNDLGTLEYTSLSDPIKEKLIEDEEFWHIVHQENWVLFQSLHSIYIYNIDTKKTNIISSETGILGIFNVSGAIYYQDKNQGIFKIEKGKAKLLTKFSPIKNDKVIHIANTNDGVLILTSLHGFYKYSDKVIKKWKTPVDSLLKKSKIYSSIQLKDKSFIIGTIAKGIIHISEKGDLIYQIDQSKGLNNNTILSIFEDVENNIWLGLDNGINCININSPIRLFNNDKGTIGTVYVSSVFKNFLYLGTNQGVFYKKIDKKEQFKFVEGTNGQVWSLFVYDDKLFCGHDSGTFLIHNNTSELISPVSGGWNFKTIQEFPQYLMQGTYTGLYLLEKKNKTWKLKQKIKGIDYSSRYLEISKNTVWINHEHKGLFKANINEQLTELQEVTNDFLIERGLNSSITKYKENIIYSNQQQLTFYDKKNKTFVEENPINKVLDGKNYKIGKLIKDNTDGLWGFSKENISHIRQSQFSGELKIIKIPIPRFLRKETVGFENVAHIYDTKYLLGRTNGYMTLDLSEINPKAYTILLDKISIKSKDTSFKAISLSQKSPQFKYKLNTIAFSYTIPEYNKYVISKFQYKLDGFYNNWSNWTTDSKVIFENLPFGEYTFMVRSKTGNTLSKNILEYKFRIDRPWYFTKLAIAIYILSFLILLLLVHDLYKRYYTKQKLKLVTENKKQFALKELENEREIMKLNNEKLIQDLESKNRELATSTMSIIKKNEILNTIKKELKKFTLEDGNFKNVEKIIDKHLNNKDDWKHFEEAFNNVDKNFLKKLKSKHSKLTPHDLRFCAYLRLNLSSKEIAPLLNISVRSVEIKRYRLRKKLSLEHKQSLVSYILEI